MDVTVKGGENMQKDWVAEVRGYLKNPDISITAYPDLLSKALQEVKELNYNTKNT